MSDEQKSEHKSFDELIVQLRAEGFKETATKLYSLLHETAWTTGSELIGELGLVLAAFEKVKPSISDQLRDRLHTCMTQVRRVWPQMK